MPYTSDEPYIVNGVLINPFEKWIIVPEYVLPGASYEYWVSNYGNVRVRESSSNKFKLVPQSQKPGGYLIVTLSVDPSTGYAYGRRMFHVHRLVLMSFKYIEGCEKMDVNHKDTFKTHNWLWNLEWTTRRDNIKHALRTGLMGLGENATGSKLSNNSVIKTCELLDEGVDMRTISNITGITYNTVYEIYRGNTWLVISKDYNFLTKHYSKYFDAKQLGDIFDTINTNTDMHQEQVLQTINYPLDSLSEPKRRVVINLVNKMRYDLGYGFIIW